jgi:hypothetical protein
MWRFLCLVSLVVTTQSFAAIPGLSGHYNKALVFSQINAIQNYPATKSTSCQSQLTDMTKDNELTILVAFGYMDFSAGQDVVDSGSSLYNLGSVLDPDALTAFSTALTRSCSTAGFSSKNQAFACGFRKSGNSFSKSITNQFTGKKTRVSVKLVNSAYSSSDVQNKTKYASQQNQKSQSAQNQFLSALQTHDAVLYLGHARSGGGPDFFPPRLLKNGHVDYGYYKKNKPGLRAMLGALNGVRGADLIGLLACKSTGLFASSVKKYSSHSALITADSLFDFDDLVPTGFTVIEALVSQRCNENFSNVVQSHLSGDQLSIFF